MRRCNRRWGTVTVAVTLLGLIASTTAASAVESRPTGNDPPRPMAAEPLRADELLAPGDLLDAVDPALHGLFTSPQAEAELTLITGDTVTVGLDRDGDLEVRDTTVAPRPADMPVTFHTEHRHGQVYVVPSDALALLHDDVLDRELFNVAKLAAHAVRGTTGVPVIVTHADGAVRSAAPSANLDGQAGADRVERFTHLDASAVTIADPAGWWDGVRSGRASPRPGGPPDTLAAATPPLAGVEKIWLDELLEVNLEDSVPQTGAPTAWESGYDGTGATVAVLDTGIDPDHPDVADRIVDRVDFTDDSPGAVDGHGHGTHVASTVAGTGAAPGDRPGVAPGAELLIGQVCDPGGACAESAVMAGMEWAAESDADVVNLSLGGGPTDGTDPQSQLVNELTDEYGSLFVISAGNSGPAARTVSAPGAADEALTVAAVDKNEEMADFSSRGPRLGDGALKPDIAAPGVGIAAARAAGTSMGQPVGTHHTTASGTSMAAPHVAGAAAIVAQHRPQLSGPAIKDLLMGTATDLGHSSYAQGAGAVNLARATGASVYGQGSLVFGLIEFPHDPVTRSITYTNVSDQPAALSLDGELTDSLGEPVPPDTFTLGTDEVTVPAGGTAEVQATIDGTVLGSDERASTSLRGVVEAVDEGGQLRASTRVSAVLEPERHDLTVEVIPPEGAIEPVYAGGLVLPVEDRPELFDGSFIVPPAPEATIEVPESVYAVGVTVAWWDEAGERHTAIAMEPEVHVGDETGVVLDLRDAQRVGLDTPEPTDTYSAEFELERFSESGAFGIGSTIGDTSETYGGGEPNWWVLPTGEVDLGTLTAETWYTAMPSVLTMRAVGGGSPVDLAPRYGSADYAVAGPKFVDGLGGPALSQRSRLKLPRLDSDRVLPLTDGGSGSAEDLAAADVDGALVLVRPLDVCPSYPDSTYIPCDFAELRQRAQAAADAGAAGLLVATDRGRPDLGEPGGPYQLDVPPVVCPDGPDSCPEADPYAALPIMSLPAAQFDTLVERLQRRPRVNVQVGGEPEVSHVYAAHSREDRVSMPITLDEEDVHRAEHRVHRDRPGGVEYFAWNVMTPGTSGAGTLLEMPRVAAPATVTTTVKPLSTEALHTFVVGAFHWTDRRGVTDGTFQRQTDRERQPVEFRSPGEELGLSYHVGPQVPTPAPYLAFSSGEEVSTGLPCTVCRQGDSLWPTMLLGSSAGQSQNTVTGFHDSEELVASGYAANSCEDPQCTTSLVDAEGNELDQHLVSFLNQVLGAAETPSADVRLPDGLDVTGEETVR